MDDMAIVPGDARLLRLAEPALIALGAKQQGKLWLVPRDKYSDALDAICAADQAHPRKKLSRREREFNREEGWTG